MRTINRNRVNRVGERHGRLVITADAPDKINPNGSVNRMVECMCDCGTTITTYLHSVRGGVASSCGCLFRELSSIRNSTHGKTNTPEYEVWTAMKKRGRGVRDFSNYFARGIRVCERWHSFENFIADMGSRPNGTSLDRIDNNRGYEPGNCRWATPKQQSRNQRGTVRVEFGGESLPLADLAERFQINHKNVYSRIRIGWDLERALTTPVKNLKRHAKH